MQMKNGQEAGFDYRLIYGYEKNAAPVGAAFFILALDPRHWSDL